MRAVLMAGGEGVRMRPLTTNIPKPLLPVVGRPLMAHSIERLRDAGITDIVVTVHYLAGQIRDYFGDGSDFGVELSYSTETRPLGTAGSVKAAHAALRDAPFLVLSGDAIANVDLAAAADEIAASALRRRMRHRIDDSLAIEAFVVIHRADREWVSRRRRRRHGRKAIDLAKVEIQHERSVEHRPQARADSFAAAR